MLVVLQNAWAKGSLESGWCPSKWLKEFKSSRTGKRIERALPDGVEVRFTNTAGSDMGDSPGEVRAPRKDHIYRTIKRTEPDVIIACGDAARLCVEEAWSGPLIYIPHPAHRLLTNNLLNTCRFIVSELCLSASFSWSRVILRQENGVVDLEAL